MNPIEEALEKTGPARSRRLVEVLTKLLKISPEAARQRLSRARTPVERYPRSLLPKGEVFFYLKNQDNTELYWQNLLRDLRETGAVYALAIDGLAARGGIVPVDEFSVVSGAPVALKKQVPSGDVARELIRLGVMEVIEIASIGSCFKLDFPAVEPPKRPNHIKARRLTEDIILDGLRQWLRNNGIGSYDSITVRGEGQPLMVGQFKWDLTGPSYLLPVKRTKKTKIQNGFVVADVFAESHLDVHQIQYFIRKVQTYQKTSNSGSLFPILMAESFTREATIEGHKVGLMLTTTKNLFGRSVAKTLADLTKMLIKVTSSVAVDGKKLYELLDKLSEIEGSVGNMRGLFFELIATNIAEREFGGDIRYLRQAHTDLKTGRSTDLDVVCVTRQNKIYVIECKGKTPGGTISLEDVKDWLGKLPIMQDFVANRDDLREYDQTYEFWTTGTFEANALKKLEFEQKRRTKKTIAWKDGYDIRRVAEKFRLKAIVETLDQHFLKHPVARQVR